MPRLTITDPEEIRAVRELRQEREEVTKLLEALKQFRERVGPERFEALIEIVRRPLPVSEVLKPEPAVEQAAASTESKLTKRGRKGKKKTGNGLTFSEFRDKMKGSINELAGKVAQLTKSELVPEMTRLELPVNRQTSGWLGLILSQAPGLKKVGTQRRPGQGGAPLNVYSLKKGRKSAL